MFALSLVIELPGRDWASSFAGSFRRSAYEGVVNFAFAGPAEHAFTDLPHVICMGYMRAVRGLDTQTIPTIARKRVGRARC